MLTDAALLAADPSWNRFRFSMDVLNAAATPTCHWMGLVLLAVSLGYRSFAKASPMTLVMMILLSMLPYNAAQGVDGAVKVKSVVSLFLIRSAKSKKP